MATLRSVNTRFWEDPWVEELTPSEKLLFLYLLTCKYANLAGIYEITIKRISFETGLNNETIRNGLKRFANDKKAYFVEDNYLFLPNWLKNQNLNSNMKKGVQTIFSQLPKDILISVLGNGYQTILKDYQTLLNTLLKYEVEVEVEKEIEIEEEKEEGFLFFWDSYHLITGMKKTDLESAKKKWAALNKQEQKKASEMIALYFNSLPDKKFCKKARTYLSDKNFNDDLTPAVQQNKFVY